MTEICSTDYHDFVIKDGKLIGEFEQMYRKSKDVPWHQDDLNGRMDVRLVVELLKQYAPFDSICDLGCGLGYFLDILGKTVASDKPSLTGYDISPTCCAQARKLLPHICFNVFDLTKHNRVANKEIRKKNEKRLFSIRATLWYVYPEMEKVVKNIDAFMKRDDTLLISQNFPPLDSSFVGKDTIANPEVLLGWFRDSFEPLRTIWLEDHMSKGNDNWFIGVLVKK